MIPEKCPYDHGNLGPKERTEIRNGLGETFDSRFIATFAYYDAEPVQRDTQIEKYDPDRTPQDPLLAQYALGRYEQYVISETLATPEGTDFHPLKVPVGEYGEEPAAALSSAGLQLVEYIAEKEDKALGSYERGLVNYHTYYGMTQKYGERSFLANEQQGVAFTIHALAALTAQKVPGCKSFTEALKCISERHTVEKLTKLVGSLTVTPMASEGFFVKQPFTPDLNLSEDMKAYAGATRRRHRDKARQARDEYHKRLDAVKYGDIDPDDVDWDEMRRLHQAGALGLTCPAADRGGSVTMTVRALSKLVSKSLS